MKTTKMFLAALFFGYAVLHAAEPPCVSGPQRGKAVNQLIDAASGTGKQACEEPDIQLPEEQTSSIGQPDLSLPGNSADLTLKDTSVSGDTQQNETDIPSSANPSSQTMQGDSTGQAAGQVVPEGGQPPQPPQGHKESFWGKIKRFFGYVAIAFNAAIAHIQDTLINPLPSLNVISEKAVQAVTGAAPSMLGEQGFTSEFEQLTNSRFTDNNSVKFLAGGPEAFPMKDRLMRQAKKNIYVTTYSFHDDITGHETANILAEKKKEGLDVKVITDYKVAYSYGHSVFPIMSAGGVEILYYRELKRRGDFWHAKMLITDDEYAIVGGMNYGDPYSHKDPDGEKWRDFDVVYWGPAVLETKKIFANAWNSRIDQESLALTRVDASKTENRDFEPGNAKIAVVFQDPPDNSYVLLSILKGIYGARSRVNIANSYFIAIPAVKQAVIDARKRGVEINILTNSSKSIDKEAQDTVIPIVRSLAQIYDTGVNIYLSQDVNMHGKFMTVDGIYANIGSYNLHPRGERYDTELNVSVIDRDSVPQLDSAFESDISRAKKVTTPEDLKIEWSFRSMVSSIIEHFFFILL
ncbi:MAG: phosphatidylserine/phosphatidylglycerophosphate/cardiolipin synthase family protein [Elusimicrobia bacterium]|nr:phosphatidylserine/phosphatidylglycerophosphate/cardiolipin synthase family protein [Elusimicrobiota bacterium]